MPCIRQNSMHSPFVPKGQKMALPKAKALPRPVGRPYLLVSVLQGGIMGFNVMGCEGRKELDRFEARKKTRKLQQF